jgi:hypothetical protein
MSNSTMTINLVRGIVELSEGKARVRKRFAGLVVLGDDIPEIRRNFKYSRAFLGRDNVKQRLKVEEQENQGLIRLVQIEVEKTLGQTNY